jgi:hypothetical protein
LPQYSLPSFTSAPHFGQNIFLPSLFKSPYRELRRFLIS